MGLLVASVAVIVVTIGPALLHGLTGASYATPMSRTVGLGAGRYVIFERTGSRSGSGPVSVSEYNGLTITPAQVHVTGPGGRPVATGPLSLRQTISRGSEIFTGAVTFRAATSGSYRVQVRSASPTRVLIARDIGAAFASVAAWFIAAVAAVLALIAGVVLLIVTPRDRGERGPAACCRSTPAGTRIRATRTAPAGGPARPGRPDLRAGAYRRSSAAHPAPPVI